MAKQKVDIELNDKELRSTIMSLAGQLSAAFKDAIEESFDPERFRFVAKDIIATAKESAKFSSKLVENEEKILSGTSDRKQIEDQIVKAKKNQAATAALINKLSESGVKFSNENLSALEQIKKEQQTIIQILESQSETTDRINKKTGLLGTTLRGISKIPFVGEFFKAEEGIKAMNNAAAKGASIFNIMGQGLKSSLSGFMDLALTKIGGVLVERTKILDQNTADLAKNLNVSYQNSNKFVGSLVDAAKASGEVSARADTYGKSILEINQTLGTSSRLDLQRIASYTKLREVSGFEPEILASVNEASYLNNTLLDNTVKTRLTQIRLYKIQNGVAINERQVLKDIAAVSNTIKLNFIGSDAALSRAATQARAMAIDLNKVDSIAGSLVDFESSIRSQMEAQVLLGKEINLDKARYFANTNQTEKLLQEINKQGLNEQQFTKATRIERESYAQAIGLSVEELSKMYIQQRVLRNLGAQDITDAKQKYNELVKQKGVAEAQKLLGDEALVTQFQQQSNQDRLVLATEKLKTSFDDVAISINAVLNRVNGFISGLSSAASVLNGILGLVTSIAAVRLFKGLGGSFGSGRNASGLIPSTSSPTGFRDAAGRFAKAPTGMSKMGGLLKGGGALGLGILGMAASYGSEMAARSGNKGLSTGLDITSSALTGAGFGAMLGPLGALAGGLLGAGYGAYQSLDEGGLVTQGGIAKVDTGEVYLGKSSIVTLREMLSELKKQTQYIQQQGNIQINMDGAAVAASVSKNSSNTFAASNLGPRPLDYTL
jgi:hypothetical protein